MMNFCYSQTDLSLFLLCNFLVFQVRHFSCSYVGAVVQGEWLSAGSVVHSRDFLRGCGGAARLPLVPDFYQLHHLGVHVPPQDLIPEDLQGRGESVRPWRPLQPVGFLLHLQDGDVGEGLPQKHAESSLTPQRLESTNLWLVLYFHKDEDRSMRKCLSLIVLSRYKNQKETFWTETADRLRRIVITLVLSAVSCSWLETRTCFHVTN